MTPQKDYQRVAKRAQEMGASARRHAPILRIFPEKAGFREIMLDRRFELGYRQSDVAEAVGCTPMMIGKIEQGIRNPDLLSLPVIASFLRLDLGEFFYRYIQERCRPVYKAIVPSDRVHKLLALPQTLQDVILSSAEEIYHQEIQGNRKRA